ncbi:hypothetical protein [Bdellovibrio sp. HCB209]|uniref:hypothetical protein n=1 Tax=Bdellovibrio sp. HCB209 TaxID=3394354 RepID=UPI0039B3B8D6
MRFIQQNIFFIDGAGAFLSAAIIGILLPKLNTGMPINVLAALSSVAVVFSLYSLSCFRLNRKPGKWLKGIAIANLIYCVSTLSVVVLFFSQLSALAIAYFILEIIVIALLACLELKIVQQAS